MHTPEDPVLANGTVRQPLETLLKELEKESLCEAGPRSGYYDPEGDEPEDTASYDGPEDDEEEKGEEEGEEEGEDYGGSDVATAEAPSTSHVSRTSRSIKEYDAEAPELIKAYLEDPNSELGREIAGSLYDNYKSYITGVIIKVGGLSIPKHEVEDALVDIKTKAWEYVLSILKTYDSSRTPFSNWLAQIVRLWGKTGVADFFRSHFRRREAETELYRAGEAGIKSKIRDAGKTSDDLDEPDATTSREVKAETPAVGSDGLTGIERDVAKKACEYLNKMIAAKDPSDYVLTYLHKGKETGKEAWYEDPEHEFKNPYAYNATIFKVFYGLGVPRMNSREIAKNICNIVPWKKMCLLKAAKTGSAPMSHQAIENRLNVMRANLRTKFSGEERDAYDSLFALRVLKASEYAGLKQTGKLMGAGAKAIFKAGPVVQCEAIVNVLSQLDKLMSERSEG